MVPRSVPELTVPDTVLDRCLDRLFDLVGRAEAACRSRRKAVQSAAPVEIAEYEDKTA